MSEVTEVKTKVEPIWMCCMADCKFSSPPTIRGFQQQAGHQLSHKGVPKDKRGFKLIDRGTEEVLAQTLKEAEEKGLLELPKVEPKVIKEVEPPPLAVKAPPEVKPTSPSFQEPKGVGIKEPPKEPLKEAPPKETPPESEIPEGIPAEETTKAEIATVKSAGTFTYEITLPADAFTLFNLAKACGLEPNPDKLFDEWVWDCVRARFSKDYKKQLILAPMEE